MYPFRYGLSSSRASFNHNRSYSDAPAMKTKLRASGCSRRASSSVFAKLYSVATQTVSASALPSATARAGTSAMIMIIADVPARAVADGKALADTVWVATEYNFAKTLELARRLQPEARNLVFIAGASEYDRLWLNDARDELRPYLNGYMTKYLAGLRYDEMLREVSKLSPDTIVLMSLVFVDGDGLPQTPPDVAAAVANAAAAPVYSPLSSFFGRGIVGGYMDSFEAHGVAAADLAYEILSGKPI